MNLVNRFSQLFTTQHKFAVNAGLRGFTKLARDMFALLPISNTIVHAVIGNDTVLSVDFDRPTLSKLKFGYIDPSGTMEKFRHNMNFNILTGFTNVRRINTSL